MNRKILTVLAFLALAGVAAAGTLSVNQRIEKTALHAERYTLADSFVVDTSPGLSPAASTIPATGPKELSPVFATLHSGAAQDAWVYTVIVKEVSVGAVPAGNYTIELQVDGVPYATLELKQEFAEPNQTEGVRASFGLGPSIGTSALYYVVVKPVLVNVPPIEYTLESKAATQSLPLRWEGVGAPINGATNPTLNVTFGTPIRVTAKNGDAGLHNIGFVPSATSTTPIPGTSFTGNIPTSGEVVITWTPGAAGTYYYRCQYHESMVGQVSVNA